MARAPRTTILAAALLCLVAACSDTGQNRSTQNGPDVPHGFVPVLRVEVDGRMARFGPFVGYYFRPETPEDLSQLRFVCFNERGFYSSDMPVNARLFEGRARLGRLPGQRSDQPESTGRITPVFFEEAPESWLASRPTPQEDYLHFHSLHDARGARMDGYWLSHEAKAAFTYDMGGRVGQDSPMYHSVTPGPDRDFARIVEFDDGPRQE